MITVILALAKIMLLNRKMDKIYHKGDCSNAV